MTVGVIQPGESGHGQVRCENKPAVDMMVNSSGVLAEGVR
jgi:hypothetical protein